MKLFKIKHNYVNKEGKEKTTYNIFLRLENGDRVYIKSAFNSTSDYFKLLGNAIEITIEENNLPF